MSDRKVQKRAASQAARFVCPDGSDKLYQEYRQPMLIRYSSFTLLIALAAVTILAEFPTP